MIASYNFIIVCSLDIEYNQLSKQQVIYKLVIFYL